MKKLLLRMMGVAVPEKVTIALPTSKELSLKAYSIAMRLNRMKDEKTPEDFATFFSQLYIDITNGQYTFPEFESYSNAATSENHR